MSPEIDEVTAVAQEQFHFAGENKSGTRKISYHMPQLKTE